MQRGGSGPDSRPIRHLSPTPGSISPNRGESCGRMAPPAWPASMWSRSRVRTGTIVVSGTPPGDDVPWLDVLKQAYLINARACTSLPAQVAGLDAPSQDRLGFAARQVTDALAPTNFLPTNPEAIRTAVESGGASTVNGIRQFLRDLDPGTGRLDVRMCAPDAFVVGESIATTRARWSSGTISCSSSSTRRPPGGYAAGRCSSSRHG